MLRCETKYGFFYIDILELMPGQLRHKIHDTQLAFFVVLIILPPQKPDSLFIALSKEKLSVLAQVQESFRPEKRTVLIQLLST